MRSSKLLRSIVAHTFLILGSAIFLFPLLWLVVTSLKPADQILQSPPVWIPDRLAFETYWETIHAIPFFQYAGNTLYICVISTVGTVVSASLVAYGFSRIQWPGRDTLFIITIATMMIPFPVTMVPLYGVFKAFGWIGSFKPLTIPAWFGGGAFNIFLLRQYFMTIPNSFADAARIDGSSEFGLYARIILPMAKPALMVVALFHFLFAWNDFLGPLLYLTDQDKFTLALGLQVFQTQHAGTPWNLLLAACTLVSLPIVVLFFFTQKTFVRGIAMTGLKE